MADHKRETIEETPAESSPRQAAVVPADVADLPPVFPAEARQYFQIPDNHAAAVYQPNLFAKARLHFIRRTWGVDTWITRMLLVPLMETLADDLFQHAEQIEGELPGLSTQRPTTGRFARCPAELADAAQWNRLQRQLVDRLYQTERLTLLRCKSLKLQSEPGESAADFQIRLEHRAHELRDEEIEKLRDRYASRIAKLQDRILREQKRLEQEQSQFLRRSLEALSTLGSTLVGAMLGRKLVSRTNVDRAGRAAREISRTAKERGDVASKQQSLEELKNSLTELNDEFAAESHAVGQKYDPAAMEREELEVPPRKNELTVDELGVLWTPLPAAQQSAP